MSNESTPNPAIHYNGYATEHANHQTWIDSLVRTWVTRWPKWLGAIPHRAHTASAVGIVVLLEYLGGLILAVCFGISHTYVTELPVYIGCAGLALVLATVRWASQHVHHVYEQLRPIFSVGDDEYRTLIDRGFHRLSSVRGTLTTSVGLTVAAIGAAVVAFWVPAAYENVPALRPRAFGTDWFSGSSVMGTFAVEVYFGVWSALAIGTAAYILLGNAAFLWTLRRFDVVPLVEVVRMRLRGVSDFYLKVALLWFGGVALFAVLFFGRFDGASIGLLAVLSVMGLVTFALPQFLFRGYLMRSYQSICTRALIRFYRMGGFALEERPREDARRLDWSPAWEQGGAIHELVILTAKPSFWVYDSADVVVLLLGQAVVIGSVAVQAALLHG